MALFARAFSSNSLSINELSPLPKKVRRRVGRGIGSGRGKQSKKGHQFSPSTPRAFEGGQTPLYKRLPKIGFRRGNLEFKMQPLNLDKLQRWIDMGRIVPKENEMLTMRDFVNSGLITNYKDGVKLLAKNKGDLRTPVHLEVSRASESAIASVEAVGGTVTCVHFNTLALRALMKPVKFELFPMRARPNPFHMKYYLDKNKAGFLSPEIQLRNAKLFGTDHITTEEKMIKEHAGFMKLKKNMLTADAMEL
jgi:large subunit ribosomal protein L15